MSSKKAGDSKDKKSGAKSSKDSKTSGAAAGGAKAAGADKKKKDVPEPGDKPKLFGGSPEGQKVVITGMLLLLLHRSHLPLLFVFHPRTCYCSLYLQTSSTKSK
jgi:hypothetical protein